MLIAAIIIFALAASGGLFLLSYVLRSKETPKGVAFIHGSVAAVGIVLLIIYCSIYSPSPWISLVLFILAAFGGFFMMYKDLTGNPVPKSVAIIHGLVAVISFILLVVFFATKT